jgi:hypothetical protein
MMVQRPFKVVMDVSTTIFVKLVVIVYILLIKRYIFSQSIKNYLWRNLSTFSMVAIVPKYLFFTKVDPPPFWHKTVPFL